MRNRPFICFTTLKSILLCRNGLFFIGYKVETFLLEFKNSIPFYHKIKPKIKI